MKYIDHFFRVELASRYGVDVAIFVNDIYYWCEKNRENQEALHDGRHWTFNKMSAFCERHPYWTRRQVERIISTCKEAGLILVDKFNDDPMLRTNWYTVTDLARSFYESEAPDETVKCISPNGEMETTERGNANHQTVKCIYKEDNIELKDIEKTPYNPPRGDVSPVEPIPKRKRARKEKSIPDHKPERFEKFWETHPGGGSRLKAVAAWDALKPSEELIDEMARALLRQMQTERWRAGIGIPLASTWLNQKRWTDKLPVLVAPPEPEPSGGWAPDPEVY